MLPEQGKFVIYITVPPGIGVGTHSVPANGRQK